MSKNKYFIFFLSLILLSFGSNANNSNFNYSFIQLLHSKIYDDNKSKDNGINFSKSINDSIFYTSSFNKGEVFLDSIETKSYSLGLGSNKNLNQLTDLVFYIQVTKNIEKNEFSGINIDQDTLDVSIEVKHLIINNFEISTSINYSNSAILDNGNGHDIFSSLGLSWALSENLSLISGIDLDDGDNYNIGIELAL